MSCDTWQEAIVGRLYGEIDPTQDRALESHLETCVACRGALDELGRLRVTLRENEPAVDRPPRVVVLRDASRFRPALLAASIVGAALLAGVGAGVGYAVGRQSAPAAAPVTVADAKATEELQKEVDRRIAALAASLKAEASKSPTLVAGVSSDELEARLAKFERRMDNKNAEALDYLAGQIEASETRTGARIGQTNQALRYVALASNPNVTER
jgi:predicted anti-sigma-YlaC factor YlaD